MIRLFSLAFALVVAVFTVSVINDAAQNATESFRASFHSAGVTNGQG